MLKQFLSLTAFCLLMFGFTACGTDEPEVNTDEVTDNTTPLNPGDTENPAAGTLTLKIKDAGHKEFDMYVAEPTTDYPVTVMKEGAAANPVKVTLKVLNDDEFKSYRDLIYGDPNFPGLQPLNPRFYSLRSANDANSVNHAFSASENDYFVGNIVIDTYLFYDWRQDLENRTTSSYAQKYPEEYKHALDTIQNFTFVIPIGLFSETNDDAIAVADRYLMVAPQVLIAEIKVSIGNDEALIVDQPRSLLIDETSDFRNGSFGQELVKFSLPCPNPYGFQIRFKNNPDADIARFNGHHTDMVLTPMPRRDANKDLNFTLGIDNKSIDYINFPAGITEIWLPIEIFRKKIDYNDMGHNYATPVQLAGFNWKGSEVPIQVQRSLRLPISDRTWIPGGPADDGKYDGYTFFIGYRVVDR